MHVVLPLQFLRRCRVRLATERMAGLLRALVNALLHLWCVKLILAHVKVFLLGIAGVVWTIFWFGMTFEKPAFHPTISAREKEYIERSIGNVSQSHPTVGFA